VLGESPFMDGLVVLIMLAFLISGVAFGIGAATTGIAATALGPGAPDRSRLRGLVRARASPDDASLNPCCRLPDRRSLGGSHRRSARL